MDHENAAMLHLLKKKDKKKMLQLADAFSLQLRIEPKTRRAEGPRRVSAEFMAKKVKLAAESKVPGTHAWRMAAIPEGERLCSEKSAARTSTRLLGKGESASKSKKAARRGTRRVTSAGTRNQDSSRPRVTTGAEEDRELARKKATLAAAAFEKWVAETARVENQSITIQSMRTPKSFSKSATYKLY